MDYKHDLKLWALWPRQFKFVVCSFFFVVHDLPVFTGRAKKYRSLQYQVVPESSGNRELMLKRAQWLVNHGDFIFLKHSFQRFGDI